MRALTVVAAAGLIAAAIVVWSKPAGHHTRDSTVGRATLVPSIPPALRTMSIWELHNQAHLENLPVQEVDDKSLVFTSEERR